MRLNKLILNSLAIGLLFNSISTSFAGVLSEDGRYETFEGDNITIDNILEEDKVDVEIEGNTLVNLNSKSNYNVYSSLYKRWIIGECLKPNTTYSIITDLSGDYITTCGYTTAVYTPYKSASVINVFTTGDILLEGTPSQDCSIWIRHKDKLDIDDELLKNSEIMLLEGDWTNKEIPEYFEGMKSVGELEDNKIKVISQNKNLWDGRYEIGTIATDDGVVPGGTNLDYGQNRKRSFYIPLKSNRIYTVSQKDYMNQQERQIYIHQYDKDKTPILWENGLHYKAVTNELTFTVSDLARYIRFRTQDNRELNSDSIMIEEGSNATSIISSQSTKKGINLSAPLRGLSNGVKDKIIKRNGQWVVERNCIELNIDGSDFWVYSYWNDIYDSETFRSFLIYPTDSSVFGSYPNPKVKRIIASDNIRFDGNINGEYKSLFYRFGSNPPYIGVRIEKNICMTPYDLKNYFKENPTKVLIELMEPIYESLNIDLSLDTYLDTTHISNSSNIPANIKVTIDRTINRATEALKLAKTNSTVFNISLARMWSNLLKESVNKDSLQNEIDGITNIEDLQLEKKIATSNIDVYIKSENMLLMSLSTNSITFNDFSGVEDMELNNVVNISINSSLPYQLNSYLLSEIENSDKSSRIEKDLLNIKVNKDSDYKTFNNINEKLVLEDDCDAGNNKSHSIDLRLKGSQAHKADIYKTVIKFEAEQK